MRIALHISTPAERFHAAERLRRLGAFIWSYPDATALSAGVASGPPPDVVVTALRDAHGRPVAPLVRRLRTRFPGVPVVAYAVLSRQAADDIVEAARAGLTAAALHGYDDLADVLQRVLSDSASRYVTDAALAAVDRRLTASTRPVVRYCLAHAHAVPTTEQIAAAIGVSRKTVAARLAADGLPPASALVSWGRVLLAAHWLEDTSCPVERAALALGFDSGTGLHHMLARYTALRAAEVRARGGLAAVLPLFVAAIGERSAMATA